MYHKSPMCGENIQGAEDELHSFHFSLSRANEGRSREQLGEKPT